MYTHKVCLFYNISRRLYEKKIPLIPKLIRMFNRIVFSCDLPYTAKIHETVDFPHNALGVVVHSRCTIGRNTKIYQNVTIGGNGKGKSSNGPPIIGENVIISAGAMVLGPVKIGDNSIIGAGAIVVDDIPPNSIAVGIPAKVIKVNTGTN